MFQWLTEFTLSKDAHTDTFIEFCRIDRFFLTSPRLLLVPVFQLTLYVIALDKTSTTDIILLLPLFLNLDKNYSPEFTDFSPVPCGKQIPPLLYQVSRGAARKLLAFALRMCVLLNIFKADNLHASQGDVKCYLA